MTDQELVTHIVSAVALSEQDIERLAEILAAAQATAAQRAYRRAQQTVGVLRLWTTSAALQKRAVQDAKRDARRIAQTYRTLLEHLVERALQEQRKQTKRKDGGSDDQDDNNDDWKALLLFLLGAVSLFLTSFLDWKPQQIANVTCSRGNDQGTNAFLVDLVNGEVIATETGEAVAIGDYAIAVLPAEASNDLCRDFAGNSYDISEADSIPDFPIHANCPHEKVIIHV